MNIHIYVVGARWLETPPPRIRGFWPFGTRVRGDLKPRFWPSRTRVEPPRNPVSGHPAPGWGLHGHPWGPGSTRNEGM